MKTFQIVAAASLWILLGSPARVWASWTGEWNGSATQISEAEGTVKCGRVKLKMTQIGATRWKTLWIKSGLPSCGLPTDFYQNVQITVEDGVLYFENKEIGMLTENHIHILKYSENGYKEYIDLIKEPGGKVIYRNAFSFEGGKGSFKTEAVLIPSSREVD